MQKRRKRVERSDSTSDPCTEIKRKNAISGESDTIDETISELLSLEEPYRKRQKQDEKRPAAAVASISSSLSSTEDQLIRLEAFISFTFARQKANKLSLDRVNFETLQKDYTDNVQELFSKLLKSERLFRLELEKGNYILERICVPKSRSALVRSCLDTNHPKISYDLINKYFLKRAKEQSQPTLAKNQIAFNQIQQEISNRKNMSILEKITHEKSLCKTQTPTPHSSTNVNITRFANTLHAHVKTMRRATKYTVISLGKLFPHVSGMTQPRLTKKQVVAAFSELHQKLREESIDWFWILKKKEIIIKFVTQIDFGSIRNALSIKKTKQNTTEPQPPSQILPQARLAIKNTTESSLQQHKLNIEPARKKQRTFHNIPIPTFQEYKKVTDPNTQVTPKKQELRMNHYLSDRNDVEKIHWEDSSPRGLKRLFSQLNNGYRI